MPVTTGKPGGSAHVQCDRRLGCPQRRIRPDSPVFEPQLGFEFAEAASQFYAVARRSAATGVQNDHVDAPVAHEANRFVARRVLGVSNDNARNAKLHDRAGTHEARLKRRVHRRVVAVAHPAGIAERRHLTMDDRVAFLYEAIVPFANRATRVMVHQYRPDRASTVAKTSGRELECPRHVTLMNLAGHAKTRTSRRTAGSADRLPAT